MKRKYFAVLLSAALAITAAFSVTGCGNADPDQEAEKKEQSAENPEEEITLRFMWWGDDVRHQATLDVIEQYETEHPNVTIEAEYGGYDGYFEKLTTQLSGGTVADIIQYNANTVSDLMAIGDVFVNLEDYADVLDTSDFNQEFIKNLNP